MSTSPNPLAGWTGTNINQPPPSNTNPISLSSPNVNPGNLANPTSNAKDILRNTGLENLQTGALRNQLIPLFSSMMGKFGGSAGDFFTKLMDLGGPFYQQKQREGFEQGVKSNQDAAAMARQQAGAAGTGFTPSGTNVAMIGGMNQQGGQSLAEQFLQNLFQNENLQMQGGQGLAQLAGLFNPSQMTGQQVSTPGSTQGPAAAEQVAAILGSLFGSKGASKSTFTGGS
jgi:hypothetical protein